MLCVIKKKFYMKKTLLITLISLIALSCTTNDTDLFRRFAVKTGTSEQKGLFKLDNGTLVDAVGANTSLDEGTRILMDYEILSSNDKTATPTEIKVVQFARILTKDVVALTAENALEIGNDPFYRIYGIGISGGYINVNFAFLYSGSTHYINMIQQSEINIPEDGIVELEFKQNSNGIISSHVRNGLVSFDIAKYRELAETQGIAEIKFKIKTRFVNGQELVTTLDYKVDNTTNDSINYEGTNMGDEALVN